jgi:5'-nucleotidase/UDP-sugar diphosphatase
LTPQDTGELASTGVNVIVGGHTNTFLFNTAHRAQGSYPTMVDTTAVVTAYAYGKFSGELNATFNDVGEIISATGEPLIMDAAVSEDALTVARISDAAQPPEEIRRLVVAETATEIVGAREECRAMECAMGNLIADAIRDRVKDQGIEVALRNGGCTCVSIDPGDVTIAEILTALPFQNTLSTFQVKGATLVAALENGVSQVEEGAGRFPQVAGMRYTFDIST